MDDKAKKANNSQPDFWQRNLGPKLYHEIVPSQRVINRLERNVQQGAVLGAATGAGVGALGGAVGVGGGTAVGGAIGGAAGALATISDEIVNPPTRPKK